MHNLKLYKSCISFQQYACGGCWFITHIKHASLLHDLRQNWTWTRLHLESWCWRVDSNTMKTFIYSFCIPSVMVNAPCWILNLAWSTMSGSLSMLLLTVFLYQRFKISDLAREPLWGRERDLNTVLNDLKYRYRCLFCVTSTLYTVL